MRWWAGCFARELPLLTVKAPGVWHVCGTSWRDEVLVCFQLGKIAGLPPSVRSVSYDHRLEWGFERLGCLPEKRKVGGSTPPLTTRLQHLHSLLTCENASQRPVTHALVSVVLYPLVTVIGRPLVHAECTRPQLAGSRADAVTCVD
jgi:hypothetical protein